MTAGHSQQAKSLCEMLVQKGIQVNHADVAWHSPEVMLEDVKGHMAERPWLKIWLINVNYPKCGWFLLAQHLILEPHPNRAESSFICSMHMGLGDAQRAICCLQFDGETSKTGLRSEGTQLTERGSRRTMMYVNSLFKRVTSP